MQLVRGKESPRIPGVRVRFPGAETQTSRRASDVLRTDTCVAREKADSPRDAEAARVEARACPEEAMTLKCPACRNIIRHSQAEVMPRPDVIYRCPICRLELMVDAERETMIVAPLPTREDDVVGNATATGTPVGRTQDASDRDRNREAVAKPRKRERSRPKRTNRKSV